MLNDAALPVRAGERQTDRSSPAAIGPVIEAVAGALRRAGADRDLAGVFERELQRVLGIGLVRLREIPARYHARLVTPTRTADSLVLDVPMGDQRVQAVLEASGLDAHPLTPSDEAVLTIAAALGGLVLAAGRASAAPRGRVGGGVVGGVGGSTMDGAADGAAPLIGSTPQCRRCVNASSGSPSPISPSSSKARAARARNWSPARSTSSVVAGTGHSSPSTAPRSSKRCSRRSCSASKTGRPPAYAAGAASSSTPTAARCFSTKCPTCRCRRRPSCCGRSRIVAVERVGGHGTHRVDIRIIAPPTAAGRAGRAASVPRRPVLPA